MVRRTGRALNWGTVPLRLRENAIAGLEIKCRQATLDIMASPSMTQPDLERIYSRTKKLACNRFSVRDGRKARFE